MVYLPKIVLQISYKDQVQAKRVTFVLQFQLISFFHVWKWKFKVETDTANFDIETGYQVLQRIS